MKMKRGNRKRGLSIFHYIALILVLLLFGCASTEGKGHWYRTDMTSFDRDVIECRASARYTYILYFPNNQPPPQVREGFDQGIFDQCMKSRSYEWVKEQEEALK